MTKEKLNILALDQASNCGWYIDEQQHGVWDFTTRKDESSGMKMLRFKAKLKEVCELAKINLIVYERVAGQHKNSIIHASKMVAIIETYAEENGIEYRAYSASEIKTFATGKGNAGKPLMVKSCIEKYGFEPIDDNEADAAHLWHLTIRDLYQ